LKADSLLISPPDASEYAPYYSRYISLVAGADVLGVFQKQIEESKRTYSALTEQQGNFRYAPGKWTIKQVLGHVTDTERIFSYRAMRIARGDRTPIEGYEQDDYVRNGPFEHCALTDLIEEFRAVRDATLRLFKNLDETAWNRRGIANNNEVSVRAVAYTLAGHELHHLRVLKEKYLTAM